MAKGKGGIKAKFGIIGGKGAPSKTVQVKPKYQHDVVEWLQQEADRNAVAVKLGRQKPKSKFAPK